ncbi:unnamed protein product [Ixodes pacificus]
MQATWILDNWQQPCLHFWCHIALFQASFWHFLLVACKGANTPKTLAGFGRAATFHWTGQSRIISADQTRVVLWSLRNCAPKGVIHTFTSSRTSSDQGTAVGSIRHFLSCFLVMNKQTASAQVASFHSCAVCRKNEAIPRWGEGVSGEQCSLSTTLTGRLSFAVNFFS